MGQDPARFKQHLRFSAQLPPGKRCSMTEAPVQEAQTIVAEEGVWKGLVRSSGLPLGVE